jgi:hypothetical protein
MHVISVQGSNTQRSKLRNGHKVRVKHGSGFNVIVNPDTYHVVSRAFNKNKGVSMQLSPEEIMMNKAPSPELQAQIMGHTQHMVIPGVQSHLGMGGRGFGTGVGDWFKNLGNQIKSKVIDPVQQKVFDPINNAVYKPIERAIIDPIKQQYEKHVPESIRRDISTGAKIMSPAYLLRDAIQKVKEGKNPKEIMDQYKEDLLHLNNTKNTIIKKSPALTQAYKKGVISTGAAAGTAFGTTLGLNPAMSALGGVAGAKAGEELLKREGYGIHHFIDHGLKKMKKSMMKHFSPISGGAITLGHVRDFFKNAGNKVKDFATQNIIKPAERVAVKGKQQLSALHQMILNNPELGKKIKQHGSKLAGLLAKEGIKYFGGDEEMQNLAGDVGGELSQAGFKEVGYGEEKEKPKTKSPPQLRQNFSTMPEENSPLKHDSSAYDFVKKEKGQGLYAGRQGRGMKPPPSMSFEGNINKGFQRANTGPTIREGRGLEPPSRLVGGGYQSFHTLNQATVDNARANQKLAMMQDERVNNQHDAEPIKRYWDEPGQPPSRGTGMHKNHHARVNNSRKAGFERHNNFNLVRGRGALLGDSRLPPALQSQPYGTNFHMQFMLPPQYHKYNDGTNEY